MARAEVYVWIGQLVPSMEPIVAVWDVAWIEQLQSRYHHRDDDDHITTLVDVSRR